MHSSSHSSASDSSHASHNQSALVLPTPSMQSQIHELAKTLPPPRKQNSACDNCRNRKVKCHRIPGEDKCQHCLSKNYACTHFVQQATSEKKRHTTVARRPRNLSSASTSVPPFAMPLKLSPLPDNTPLSPQIQQLPLLVRFGLTPPITIDSSTRDVLQLLFAPPESPQEASPFARNVGMPYALWGDQASKLEDDNFKAEFALDLVEVFFQIVHTRLPLLNPGQFRNRLQYHLSTNPNGHFSKQEKPLHPALVATVLAWGTKFSEHPLLLADRARSGGQSLLAKTLIDRTRDLAEAMRVHRIPSEDHVVIGLLIEPLQNQSPGDPNGYHTFWLRSATQHLLDMGINHKSVTSTIQDPESRGTMIFAWWMACMADAYGSAYYRYKPILDDDDYDMDFYVADPALSEVQAGYDSAIKPSPREQLEFLGYYKAAHSLARTARQMSRQLWRPVTEAEGVPFDVVKTFWNAFNDWRTDFLSVVGVPTNFEGEWDFVSAVSSCASDATYHIMWIILFSALDEFGIKEVNDAVRMGTPPTTVANQVEIETLARKIADEALHGALRIAGLAGVLASNGYLRLDPAVMHVSCIQAGVLLARLGRPEVSNCIAGLEQYGSAYEEAGEAATDIRKRFTDCTSRPGESNFTHMGFAILPPRPTSDSGMLVDEPMQPPRVSSSP